MGAWVENHRLDALWLHRPWRLEAGTLPPDFPVLFHHLPFDEHLTTGMNLPLAHALGMNALEELGYKQIADELGTLLPKRAIGMIGNAPERTCDDWLALIAREFGGYDRVGLHSVGLHSVGLRLAETGWVRVPKRVAVVGAMNPALVREAYERGVGLYLTGEYRKGTQDAVDETGIGVIAIGHHRTELWGLRALAELLRSLSGLAVQTETSDRS